MYNKINPNLYYFDKIKVNYLSTQKSILNKAITEIKNTITNKTNFTTPIYSVIIKSISNFQ